MHICRADVQTSKLVFGCRYRADVLRQLEEERKAQAATQHSAVMAGQRASSTGAAKGYGAAGARKVPGLRSPSTVRRVKFHSARLG